MLTVEEALAQILAFVRPLEREVVDVVSALGRVLAEDIVSGREIPPWPNSSMDGYALRAVDSGAGAALRIVEHIAAGRMPTRRLVVGEAARIFTGAPLPEGADAVVPQEDVDAAGDRVALRGRVAPGAYVRVAGEDVRVGDRVLEIGHVLGAAEVGLLATLGRTLARVYRRPRVAILSTGDEIADLGATPRAGQIPNTNTYSLWAQVLEAGGAPLSLGVAPDRLDAIEERVRRAADADVIVSSAGVSVGDHDHVRDALERAGARLHLWQVSMRPGKPITFGSLGRRPIFGLPGNPVSAMVTFELFVRPALLTLAGRRRVTRARLVCRALERIDNPGSRRGYLRVTLSQLNGGFGARLTGEQGSAILRSMVLADGLAVVSGDTSVEAGKDVEVILLRPLELIVE